MEDGEDRISDMPGDIMDKIFLSIPFKEAVRTSILSTKWRYKWTSIPELVFRSEMEIDASVSGHTLIEIVDQVLRFHVGPVTKFNIFYTDIYDSHAINRWIHHLSGMPLREFVFLNANWKAHEISRSIFSFTELVHLTLSWCAIDLPPEFKGLVKLESLDLTNVSSTKEDIEKLISTSLRLMNLTLWLLESGIDCLNICAPNLQTVDIRSSNEHVNFQTPNKLVSVTLWMSTLENNLLVGTHPDVSTESLQRFFNDLPLVETLELKDNFLKILSDDEIPISLSKKSFHLKKFSCWINFGDANQILTVLCIIRSCPNLEELAFFGRAWDAESAIGNFWEDYYQWRGTFKQVKSLSFTYVRGTQAEMELIKFMLYNTPRLEKVEYQVPSFERVGRAFLELLLMLPFASPRIHFKYRHRQINFERTLIDEDNA